MTPATRRKTSMLAPINNDQDLRSGAAGRDRLIAGAEIYAELYAPALGKPAH